MARLVQWDSNANPIRTAAYRWIAAEFMRLNPTVTVEYVAVPFERFRFELESRLAGSEGPDVFDVWPTWVPALVEKGFLLPLDAAVDVWAHRYEFVSEHEALSRFFGGKWWFLVVDLFLQGTHYRADLVRHTGCIDPRRADQSDAWTWDAFLSVVRALRPFGPIAFRGGSGAEITLFNLMVGAGGGRFFRPDGRCVLSDPGCVAALDCYSALVREQKVQATALEDGYQSFTEEFYRGAASIMLHNDDGVKALNFFAESAYQTCRLPRFGQHAVSGLFGFGIGVSGRTTESSLASEYVCFFAEHYVDGYVASVHRRTSAITGAPMRSDLQRPELLHPVYEPFFNAEARRADRLYLPPFAVPGYERTVNEIVLPDFRRVCRGDLGADKAAARWANEFEAARASP